MSRIVEHTEHELEELIRAAKEAAWSVGYLQGVLDEQIDATHSNPYRKGSPNVYGD